MGAVGDAIDEASELFAADSPTPGRPWRLSAATRPHGRQLAAPVDGRRTPGSASR
jgi:hypothetical protein